MKQEINGEAKIRYNQLGVILKREGVSQIVLSILMEVTEESVSNWVTNKQQPPVADMYKIAKLLDVNVLELFVETKPTGTSEAKLFQLARTKTINKNSPPKFRGSKKSDK